MYHTSAQQKKNTRFFPHTSKRQDHELCLDDLFFRFKNADGQSCHTSTHALNFVGHHNDQQIHETSQKEHNGSIADKRV